MTDDIQKHGRLRKRTSDIGGQTHCNRFAVDFLKEITFFFQNKKTKLIVDTFFT